MDKLKSMFGGHKHEESSAPATSSSTTQQPIGGATGGSRSGGNPDNAEGVVLHTTLGDITIALFKNETPKVSLPSDYLPQPKTC